MLLADNPVFSCLRHRHEEIRSIRGTMQTELKNAVSTCKLVILLQPMRKFVFAVCLCCLVLPVQSQIMSGFNASGAISVGRLSNYGAGGIGFGGQGKFFVIERLSLGFNIGWTFFFGKEHNFSIIPIRGAVEYYFKDEGSRIRPYAGSDIGIYITSHNGPAQVLFGVGPGGGVLFELSDYVNISVGAKYNMIVDNGVSMYIEPKVSLLYVFGMY